MTSKKRKKLDKQFADASDKAREAIDGLDIDDLLTTPLDNDYDDEEDLVIDDQEKNLLLRTMSYLKFQMALVGCH